MSAPDKIAGIVSRLARKNLISTQTLTRGRNSLATVVLCQDGSKYLVKEYFGVTPDGRDRLRCEYSALRWLVRNGETQVPRPIALDAAAGVGIYEFIEGRHACSGEATPGDIDQAVEFFARLDRLRAAPDAEMFPPAAEACFSLPEIAATIRRRLDVLLAQENSLPQYREMRDFLARRVVPRFEELLRREQHRPGQAEWFGSPISVAQRILSPSDYGFHNAIRRQDGRLVFVDFEYFGWDDPVKTVADFILHPAMTLSPALKERFAAGIIGALPCCRKLAARLPVAYSVFGLKWCLILLNEYVETHRARRRFSGDAATDEELLDRQLAKAQSMFDLVNDGLPEFPFRES